MVVLSFNRVGRAIWAVLRRLRFTLTQYFDDFSNIGPCGAVSDRTDGLGGHQCLRRALDILGWSHVTKQEPTATGVTLGSTVALANALVRPGGTVELKNTDARTKSILAEIDTIESSGRLPSGQSASLRGRCSHACGQTHYHVGRAAMHALKMR